jgi:hypothetical protein
MAISLRESFSALICISVFFALSPQARAQGDDTNAALVVDPTLWAAMHQTMAPNPSTPVPMPAVVRGPQGIYALTVLSGILDQIDTWNRHNPSQQITNVHKALKNFYGVILSNTAVSGLAFVASWADLNPDTPTSSNPYRFEYLEDVFDAIDAWNSANCSNATSPPTCSAPGLPKTVQLIVDPGINSPDWLFKDYLTSCDGLFMSPHPGSPRPSKTCGYTTIFNGNKPFPLPWSSTYKTYWQGFLTALNAYITVTPPKPTYVSDFVSIAVAGPTISSEEIILPNNSLANFLYGTDMTSLKSVPPGYSANPPMLVSDAWNCLLAHNYTTRTGSNSYFSADRAFVAEWAAAIDIFGQVFSGVTLTVSTGGGPGLPDFTRAPSSSSCGLTPYPTVGPPPSIAVPPPVFAALPYCDPRDTVDAVSCAAQSAIVAYFSEPPVGGLNAKATQMDALQASSLNPDLTDISVKWLSVSTERGLTQLIGSPAVVSRMLAGLQFNKSFVVDPQEGCLTAGCSITPEAALYNLLQRFFLGTPVNSQPDLCCAPINYLQVYYNDINYSSGFHACNTHQMMTMTAARLMATCYVAPSPVATPGGSFTAEQLLQTASAGILKRTTIPIVLPGGTCKAPYEFRNGFQGDNVCVTAAHKTDFHKETLNYAANYMSMSNYTMTSHGPPYGVCKPGYVYRQAFLGDYVCVTTTQANDVATDNAEALLRF